MSGTPILWVAAPALRCLLDGRVEGDVLGSEMASVRRRSPAGDVPPIHLAFPV